MRNLKFLSFNEKKKTTETIHLFSEKITNSLGRTFISCFFVLAFFYVVPIFISFVEDDIFIKEYENNSRKIMVYKLSGKDTTDKKKREKEIDIFNEKDLLSDILTFNDLENDSVRLNATTINQLFEDTSYDLEDVRINKLVKPVALTWLPYEIKKIENVSHVKPVALTWLPYEIKKIENVKKRKNLFIQIVLPLILQENNNIKLDRIKLFGIINKSNNTELEKKWLNKKYKQYGVNSKDLSTLKMRMDEIPTSLVLAQAAKETGWGTSRFALEGNALFGQWTWSGEGLKPKDADASEGHKVMKFNILQASVRAYQRNLNTHKTYKSFRKARAELREAGKELDSIILSNYLDKYAETGMKYVEIIQQIIEQNNLKDFDDARLLPSSKRLESLI